MSDEECTDADDAVEEVRQARRRIWELCDNDPRKYAAYMRELGIRLVRAGWPEAPPPRDGQCAGSADEDRTTGEPRTDEADTSDAAREAKRAQWERFINQPGKLLALLQDVDAQLVREGFIKPDIRSPGQGKSAACSASPAIIIQPGSAVRCRAESFPATAARSPQLVDPGLSPRRIRGVSFPRTTFAQTLASAVSDATPATPQSAASAARRATDDPHVFLIPREALPAGFEDKVATGEFTPAPTRPAATVLLVRDSQDGPEFLLLRRHGRSGFAAGAWVFPGGVVDGGDQDLGLVERMDGPTPMQWAERLGLSDPADAVSYVVAAAREAFEETGILLARVADDATNPGAAREGLDIARRALLAEVVDLRQVIVTRSLRITGDRLLYLAHWITPEPEPRRYDTRFFLARVDPGAVCTPHEAELTESVWLTARGAVHFFESGSLKMLPPTVHTLRRLAGYESVDAIFAALADAPVPAIMPVMRVVPDGVAIVLPGEARE